MIPMPHVQQVGAQKMEFLPGPFFSMALKKKCFPGVIYLQARNCSEVMGPYGHGPGD